MTRPATGRERDFAALRADMVERQLRRRGIRDPRVLDAMGAVERERFVPERQRRRAYNDSALPIGGDQTISQPWIVAAICQALSLTVHDRVLEVGTGSGYSACVISRLAAEVVSVERDPDLAAGARLRIANAAAENVQVVVGDGSMGFAENAPYNAIAVHAVAPGPPPSLLAQLAPDGRLVIPVATDRADMLTLYRDVGGELDATVIGPCRFVRLVGAEGFPE